MVKIKQKTLSDVALIHLVFSVIYAASLIAFDAWNLITPEAIVQRWMVVAFLGVVSTLVWYFPKSTSKKVYKWLAYDLILAGIVFASFNVFTQRGVASKAVILYLFPIIAAAVILSRTAAIATTIISSAIYFAVTVRYFYNFPGEALKVELYAETALYIAILFVIMFLTLKLRKGKS